MLIIVNGTRYAFPLASSPRVGAEVWRNTIEWLHDPRRFGIAMPRSTIKTATPPSTERRTQPATRLSDPTARS
jgi:hypothetical protein